MKEAKGDFLDRMCFEAKRIHPSWTRDFCAEFLRDFLVGERIDFGDPGFEWCPAEWARQMVDECGERTE